MLWLISLPTDNEDPVINNCPNGIVVGVEPGTSSTPVSWVLPTATDNLGAVTLTSSHRSELPFSVGTETVTYTATDEVGNEAQCVFSVIVLTGECESTSVSNVNFMKRFKMNIDYTLTR